MYIVCVLYIFPQTVTSKSHILIDNITITVYMMTRKQEVVDDFGATTNY